MVRALVVFLCLHVCVLAAPRARVPWSWKAHGRIINGTEASIADFPWVVAIELRGIPACGASIISSSWSLSAAHCVYGLRPLLLSLRAGSSMRGSGGVVLDVSQAIMHDDFDYAAMDYDFAVIQVSEPFPLEPSVQTVGLPPDGYDPPVGLPVTVAGWGMTQEGWVPDVLQRVDLEVLDRSVCQENLGSYANVTARMLCIGQDPHGACHGDSGSPLVHNATQLGIVSWGDPNCFGPGAVYGNVGNVRAWIRNITGA